MLFPVHVAGPRPVVRTRKTLAQTRSEDSFVRFRGDLQRFKDVEVRIRPARDNDLQAVKDLTYRIYREYGEETLIRWYENNPGALTHEFYGPAPGRRRFARIVEDPATGGAAGIAVLHPKSASGEDAQVGEVSKLYLEKAFRGKGIARHLMNELIGQARQMGFDTLYLTTRKKFVEAISLYKSLGFTEVPNDRYQSANSIAMEMRL